MISTRLGRARSVIATALLGTLVAVGCTAPPPTAPAPVTAPLAGAVTGTGTHLGDDCPVGQRFLRRLELRVDAPTPSELVVEVCQVETTAMGGAGARGGFRLTTPDGEVRGTATGSWTWHRNDILRVELRVSTAQGALGQMYGSLELLAEVELGDQPAPVTGTLTALT